MSPTQSACTRTLHFVHALQFLQYLLELFRDQVLNEVAEESYRLNVITVVIRTFDLLRMGRINFQQLQR